MSKKKNKKPKWDFPVAYKYCRKCRKLVTSVEAAAMGHRCR